MRGGVVVALTHACHEGLGVATMNTGVGQENVQHGHAARKTHLDQEGGRREERRTIALAALAAP